MRERLCVCCLWSESDFIYITLSRTRLKFDLLCVWMHVCILGSMRGKDERVRYNKQIKGFLCSHFGERRRKRRWRSRKDAGRSAREDKQK